MPKRQLSWQPGFSLSRKPAKRPARPRNQQNQFQIIVEHPQHSHHRAGRSQPVTTPPYSGSSSSDHPKEHLIVQGRAGGSFRNDADKETDAIEENELPIDADSSTSTEPSYDLEAIDDTIECRLSSYSSADFSTSSSTFPEFAIHEHHVAYRELSAVAPRALANMPSTPLLPPMEYSSLIERFRPILDRYNTEFCTIPLTFELRINPFRYRTDLDPEPIFLIHAVMALAGHHVNSTSSLSHRHASLQLLRQNLQTFSDSETMYSMLDTIVILFSLDETQSILGTWGVHLTGAYNILEACGGINNIPLSSRIETQIGILTWWDAITSLLSREECVFPYDYFDAVLSNQHKREWSFFGLCGCPTSIVKIVMRVARLGVEKRRETLALHPSFDNTIISEIENSLESWCHIPSPTALRDEDGVHQDLDVMHCSEAWRNGLLLYIFRVFRWEPGDSVPTYLVYRARTIVDHVIACRDVNMVSRQALLPLFFAGCELRDKSTQAQIVKLCSLWDERTRYHMFRGAIPLLEELWAEQQSKDPSDVWWGQIVDRWHTSNVDAMKVRLCFG